jgi:dolichyl-phosphate-mannose--protein O-mannosyl transferase
VSTVAKLVLVVAAVTLVGGILRFQDLGEPSRKYFDEVYYASDGCLYAGFDFRECDLDTDSERSWVHPPLGKAFISWGIEPPGPVKGFGNTPLGWRVSAAAAGTATVALAAVLAYLLLGSLLWAGTAGLLLATENLHFVQSRIAMLDVFLTFLVVLGFLFLVADRRANERAAPADLPVWGEAPPPELTLGAFRPLRLLAGAAFGAAVAVKWSGLLALAGAAGLSVAWSIAAARRLRREPLFDRRAARRGFGAEALGQAAAFILIPAFVYAAAWLPWLADRGFDFGEWLGHHVDMADYHFGLDTADEQGDPIHPYLSPAWSWFLMARPVAYFWEGDPNCCREILGMGHPFLFWGGLVLVPYLAIAWFGRRQWQAGAVLVPILIQYVPWLFVSRPLFLFYMTPVTPFLAVGTAFLLRDLARVPRRRTVAALAAGLVVAVSVGMFAFFRPVLAADPISYQDWQRRMWIYADGTVFNWI